MVSFIKNLFSGFRRFMSTEKSAIPDLFESDCMVGIVKNETQLRVTLAENFYHTPAKNIYELALPIKYVALYTSAKTFGASKAGIFYYGKVASYKILPRFEITSLPKESTEPYFMFKVDKWEKLEKPVKPLEIAQVITITSFRLLKSAEYMPELYLKSREELALFKFLIGVCITGTDKKRYNFNGIKIGVTDDSIEVIFADGRRKKYDRYSYMNKPYALLRNITVHKNKRK